MSLIKDFSPLHSEVLVIIGAGATAKLGMPQSGAQTDVFRKLSEENADYESILKEYFSSDNLSMMVSFFKILDGDKNDISNFKISDSILLEMRNIYRYCDDEELLRIRILELRRDYDWNALKKIIRICPHNKKNDNLIRDVYSIIDKKLLSHQSIKVSADENEEILPVNRLQGARNFLTLFVNMLFASAWYKIANGEKSDEFNIYKKYILWQRRGNP